MICELGKRLRGVRHDAHRLRREWTAEAQQVHGEQLGWQVRGAINRAIGWEKVRQTAERLAAKVSDEGDAGRALALLEQAARAAGRRDEALTAALTRSDEGEPYADLYGPDEPPETDTQPRGDDDPQPDQDSQDAAGEPSDAELAEAEAM